MTASSPPQAVYTAAVESVSRGVLRALDGAGSAFRLADSAQCAGDRTAELVALRVVGADALLPFRLGLAEWCDEDAELMCEALDRFALPAATDASPPGDGAAAAVPALRDWATREAMAQLGTTDARCPFPGLPAELTEGPGPGWAVWSVLLAQLSPLAGLGAASPVPGLVIARAQDAARGLSRALLRADRLTAARLARWIHVARAACDGEVAEWSARAGVHVDAAHRHLELVTDASEVQTRLELAAAARAAETPTPAGRRWSVPPVPASTGSPAGAWVSSAREIASRGWSWLEECLPHFVLPEHTAPEALNPDRHLKPLGELALCASVALRDGESGPGARAARTLLEFSWAQLHEGDVLAARQRLCPSEVSDPFALETYVHFARAGYRHAGLEALLVHQAGLRVAAASREAPERALAVIAARELLGLPEALPVDDLIPTTWLGCLPEPWTPTLTALYAMTHVVYYRTDWGADPDRLPAALVDYLGRWLPVWLDIYLEVGHWDIAGELLLVDLCMPDPQTPHAAWEQLRAAQQSDGLLPGDAGCPIGTGLLAAQNHYHTTGVAVSAASLGLARHRQRG